MNKNYSIGLVLGMLLIIGACAKVGTLTGGPEDTQAPQIDSLKSTPNFQVRFEKQRIELTFDEWIVLNDVFNQVVISPPLQNGKPEVNLYKKTVRVDFPEEEVLRSNATYILNFGEAIKDYTQGNIVKNLRFVFSTGDYIDSLEVNGKIVDAFTGKAVEGALMMLYDNLADTVVRKEVPFYFSKTDEQGQFKLQNLKADTFKTFVLLSKDPNYIYDQKSEQIGFLDSFIVLNDSANLDLNFRLFQENPELKLKSKEGEGFGYRALVYNQKPWEAVLDYEKVGQKVVQLMEEDTLKLWYNWPTADTWKLFSQQDTLSDTLNIDTTGRAAFFRTAQLKIPPANVPTVPLAYINPFQGISLRFNHPLDQIDTSKIFLREDTILQRVNPSFQIDSIDARQIEVRYSWKEEMTYQLELLPGALSDLYGLQNDSLKFDYKAHSPDEFGKFTIRLVEMDSSKQYVFQLLKKEKIHAERVIRGDSTYQMVYQGLPLGSDYQVRLIEDAVANGRWDTGNYDKKRQPERLIVIPLQELRANFEAEEELKAKF